MKVERPGQVRSAVACVASEAESNKLLQPQMTNQNNSATEVL